MKCGIDVRNNTLLRQWQLLRQLPRYPSKATAGELQQRLESAGFKTTKRTVERDLNLLSAAFPVELDDRNRPYGWSWTRSAPILDVPGLTGAQALSFTLVRRFLATLLPSSVLHDLAPYFKAAEQRLAAHPKTRGAPSWAEKIRTVPASQPLLPPRVDQQTLDGVYEGLLANRQIRLLYRKRDASGPVEYLVHPLALVQRGAVTYLVCTLFQYQDVVLLAAHRVLSAVVEDAAASRPKDFDLDRYIAADRLNFGAGKKIRLEALFAKDAASHLEETALSDDQELRPIDEQWVKITATVGDTPQLRWWLGGFGAQVEVLKPKRLRADMAATAVALSRLYRSSRRTG